MHTEDILMNFIFLQYRSNVECMVQWNWETGNEQSCKELSQRQIYSSLK